MFIKLVLFFTLIFEVWGLTAFPTPPPLPTPHIIVEPPRPPIRPPILPPIGQDPNLLEYIFNPNLGDGSYYFKYVLTDGTMREETGTLRPGPENMDFVAVKGSYAYIVDGRTIRVTYEADEGGFRPEVELS